MENTGTSYPPRQTLSPDVADGLRQGLVESHLTYTAAAQLAGISHGYLHHLTHGVRCPSNMVAGALISTLNLGPYAVGALLQQAAEGRGKDRQQSSDLGVDVKPAPSLAAVVHQERPRKTPKSPSLEG